jgi:hypothetical protein
LFGNTAPKTIPIPTIVMNRPPAGTIGKTDARDSA